MLNLPLDVCPSHLPVSVNFPLSCWPDSLNFHSLKARTVLTTEESKKKRVQALIETSGTLVIFLGLQSPHL